MKKAISIILAFTVFSLCANNDWLHIYRKSGSINTGEINNLDSISMISSEITDTLFTYISVTRGGCSETIPIEDIVYSEIGTNVPTIYIDIEDKAEVIEKSKYLNAKIHIKSYESYEDLDTCEVQIRGRGNTTWYMDKKPYRIKFPKKRSLFGLKKQKNYALIANMFDPSMYTTPRFSTGG